MAVAISRPTRSSAATDMTTRAKQSGGTWTLNGSRWISNGGEATSTSSTPGSATIPAQSIGALIVEERPGVSFGAQEKLMGFRGIPSADVIFDDVRVPTKPRRRSGGFAGCSRSSPSSVSATPIGLAIAQAALDRTVAYVQGGASSASRSSNSRPSSDPRGHGARGRGGRQLLVRAAAHAGTGLPDPFSIGRETPPADVAR